MEQILDVDAGQPPYVELFTHHPLMFMSLCNHRLACKQATPKELLFWSHSVQCKIDGIASSLGLYKVKVLGYHGPCCMFASTPDMPPKQQAEVMFIAAKRLRTMLAEVPLPGGNKLASQITIHAGKYAGGVVGKSSWSYELFGSDVQDLLDMDRFNSPNSIQVSDPVLALLGLEHAQFAPACKLVCGMHEVLLHKWIAQAPGGLPGMQPVAAAALKPPPASYQLPAVPLSPVDERVALQQHAINQAAEPYGWGSEDQLKQQQPRQQQLGKAAFGRSTSASSARSTMQQDLLFRDAELERNFIASQAQQWTHMDAAFAAVTLLLLAATAYGGGVHDLQQQLLLSMGQWLVPAAAGCWMVLHPHSYCKRREALWAVHRVLAALHIASVLVFCLLQQRQLAGVAAGAAAVGVAAQGLLSLQRSVAGLLRRRALAVLVESLGFKVRLRVHVWTLGLNAAVTAMGVLWQWWSGVAASGASGTTAAAGGSPAPWIWELLLRLCLSCLAPTVLLYFWEVDERTLFLASRHCATAGAEGLADAYPAGKCGKAKAV